MIGPDDVKAAAAKLDGVAHPTPVLTSRTLDRKTDAQIFLKAECFQRSGSFKFRGTYNALTALPATARARGAVCFSTGNHGLAIAFAAKLFGIPATVLPPQDTAEKKQETARALGASLIFHDRLREDREVIAATVASRSGVALITPCDDAGVIAGQGTAARELIKETSPLDVFLVASAGEGSWPGQPSPPRRCCQPSA